VNEQRLFGRETRDEIDRLRGQVAALQAEILYLRQDAIAARSGARVWEAGKRPGLTVSGAREPPGDGDRAADPAPLRSDEQLRAVVERAEVFAIFTIDMQGRITSWTHGARELLGWEEAEALGRSIAILYTPEDHAAGLPEAEMAQALAEGRAEHDRWHLRADGRRIWGTEVVTPMPGGGGETRGFLKVLCDRTAQRREEEQRRQLVAELDHRVRNTLAIVQSLVALTARGTADAAALRAALEARLDALAVVHDLLTREAWSGAELAELVRAGLAPHAEDGGRVQADGPSLRLSPNAALVLGMALHELASNAAKYGALTAPGGRVEVAWSLDRPPDAPGGATLDLQWCEFGGPPIEAPPTRGLGSRLIEDTVTYQLDGDARLTFETEGAICRFRLPLSPKVMSLW
jgi:PAS domain S-box-containing protein